MRAIETVYKNYRFRSRLEARWAVFFDVAEIPWQYELEGFTKTEGEGEFRTSASYLPDFYLPNSQTWVEVKGSDELLRQEWERLAYILDWGSPLPGVQDSYIGGDDDRANGLLLLGDIPFIRWGVVAHPLIQHHEGLVRSSAIFAGNTCERLPESRLTRLSNIPPDEYGLDGSSTHWTVASVAVSLQRSWKNVMDAYAAARAARFEHGECGIS